MAYHNSSYYQSGNNNLGEYHQITSYNGDYFYNESLDSVNYSSSSSSSSSSYNNNNKDPSIYNLFDYDPTPYYHTYNNYNRYSAYDHHHHLNPSWSSTTSYSTFTPTESKSVVYEPYSYHMISYDQNPQTRFAISYSVSDQFNVPEFDDYDPTPYDGGYDIAQTYGKPLPPSDQICYPRSTALGMIIPKVASLDNHHEDKEKETKAHDDDHEREEEIIKTKDQESKLPKEAAQEEEKKKLGQEENDTDKERISREEVNYDYGSNNQVTSQIPSGYGLEAMDLCESIFGYWPCLDRYARKANIYNSNCHDDHYNNGYYYSDYHNWNGAADYLFGSSDPYVEKRDGGGSFGMPIHCYQRRSQEQPLSLIRQLEYYDGEHDRQLEYYCSWSHNSK